jgi:hypothetical protein
LHPRARGEHCSPALSATLRCRNSSPSAAKIDTALAGRGEELGLLFLQVRADAMDELSDLPVGIAAFSDRRLDLGHQRACLDVLLVRGSSSD